MAPRFLLSFASSLQPIFPFLVAAHSSLTVLTIVNSHLIPSPSSYESLNGDGNDDKQLEECFDAHHYDLVRDFVSHLYQHGEMLSKAANNQQKSFEYDTRYKYDKGSNNSSISAIHGIKLAHSAIFEDPVAVCCGSDEIQEAFRALQALEPVALSPPKCIDVQPQGESILLTFALHQQYTLPWYGTLNIRSILQVTAQLQQIHQIAESEFLVTKMMELWAGKPLSWPYFLYYPSRRLNGMLSYRLTSWLL